jgi:hypothetical protein
MIESVVFLRHISAVEITANMRRIHPLLLCIAHAHDYQ